jgi:hypothetical protein
MKFITPILTIACVLLTSAFALFAQEKEITKDEYYSPWRAARTKARELNRRNISKTERFIDGKVSDTDEWRYEYDGKDKIHYVHIVNSNGKTFRTEEITIGQTRYCKKNDGPWEQVTSSCIGGGASSMPNTKSVKYTVEKAKLSNKEVSLYVEYITYKDTFSKNEANEGLSYNDSRFWLSKDGLIVREERSSGLIDPKRLNKVTVDTYEYDTRIRIEAPIK